MKTVITSSVRQLCNRHDSSWLGKRGKNMKVTINTITMAAFYHDTLHFSFPYNELYVYTLPISMMRQRQVESIALLLRTKSNTCSKTPPYQHTLSNNQHLLIITPCQWSTSPWIRHTQCRPHSPLVHISYPSISLHPLPSPRAKLCERYRSNCPKITQITMFSTCTESHMPLKTYLALIAG